MPVIAVAPNNQLLDKLKSNLEEIRARGGELFVIADEDVEIGNDGVRCTGVDHVRHRTLEDVGHSRSGWLRRHGCCPLPAGKIQRLDLSRASR